MAPINITDLDHDSLDNILSYCPNRACYEIQSMRETCSEWYSLFNFGENTKLLNNSKLISGEEGSIMNQEKEIIRNSNLRKRILEMYLPRVYFGISVPLFTDDSDSDTDVDKEDSSSIYSSYFEEFRKIFGDSVRIVSNTELEIDFEMEESILEDLEQVIVKNIAVNKGEDLYTHLVNRSMEVEPCKIYHVVKKVEHEERELKKHVSLIDLFDNWKKQPILDREMKVNPCRLYKKVILHLIFNNINDSQAKCTKFSRESTIVASKRRTKGFLFTKHTRDQLNFNYGTVAVDFKIIYNFKRGIESIEERARIIAYHFLRDKLIPVMEESLIDLKKVFRKEALNYVKSLKNEDLYYFLIVKENILKKYRDGLLSGSIKFPDFTLEDFNYKVNGYIIPQFLNHIVLESMDNKQRGKLLQQLIKHIYKSQVSISDEALEEYFQSLPVESRREQFNITEDNEELLRIDFTKLFFERETYTFYHHQVSFPSFPSICLDKIDDHVLEDQTITKLTGKGKVDKSWTETCCMNRACGLCNCCTILSCWCATSCCCYNQSLDADTVQVVRALGFPKWVGWMFNSICCYRHRFFPMLDCVNLFDQCFVVKDGVDSIEYRYNNMYLEKKKVRF